MLNTILAITGKPGLYKLLSRGTNMFIVESVSDKRRMPIRGNDKVISLENISMYTDEGEVPLREVLTSLKEKENGETVKLDAKKASTAELMDFFAEVLPDFDRDRVHASDIRKLISWYNLLVTTGNDDFSNPEEAEQGSEQTTQE